MHKILPLKERIRATGLRLTPGRLALATYLEKANHPVGTPTLAKQFVPSTFDLATLYRTLQSFAEQNLVRPVTLDTRFASYEWVENETTHHHHLICQRCGKIVEIPPCDLQTLENNVLQQAPSFATVSSHSLEFFGVCKSCQREAKRGEKKPRG